VRHYADNKVYQMFYKRKRSPKGKKLMSGRLRKRKDLNVRQGAIIGITIGAQRPKESKKTPMPMRQTQNRQFAPTEKIGIRKLRSARINNNTREENPYTGAGSVLNSLVRGGRNGGCVSTVVEGYRRREPLFGKRRPTLRTIHQVGVGGARHKGRVCLEED